MVIHKWICSGCGLLNEIKIDQCRNCNKSKNMSLGCVHFRDMEHMKRWLKLAKEKMGASIWWSS